MNMTRRSFIGSCAAALALGWGLLHGQEPEAVRLTKYEPGWTNTLVPVSFIRSGNDMRVVVGEAVDGALLIIQVTDGDLAHRFNEILDAARQECIRNA